MGSDGNGRSSFGGGGASFSSPNRGNPNSMTGTGGLSLSGGRSYSPSLSSRANVSRAMGSGGLSGSLDGRGAEGGGQTALPARQLGAAPQQPGQQQQDPTRIEVVPGTSIQEVNQAVMSATPAGRVAGLPQRAGQMLGTFGTLGQDEEMFTGSTPAFTVDPTTGAIALSPDRDMFGEVRDAAGRAMGLDMNRDIPLDRAVEMQQQGTLADALQARGAGLQYTGGQTDYYGTALALADMVTSSLMMGNMQGMAPGAPGVYDNASDLMALAATQPDSVPAPGQTPGSPAPDTGGPMLAELVAGSGRGGDRPRPAPASQPQLDFGGTVEEEADVLPVSTAFRSPYDLTTGLLQRGGGRIFRKTVRG